MGTRRYGLSSDRFGESEIQYPTQLNTSHSSPSSPSGQWVQTVIRGERLNSQEPPSLEEEEKYDLILGADIVYEKGHAELIRRVVERAWLRAEMDKVLISLISEAYSGSCILCDIPTRRRARALSKYSAN
jgi:hypothetical protein